jgi:hypothetical protein
MAKDNKEDVNIVSNDAIRGKPYLDIDRVINDGKSNRSDQMNQKEA